MIKYSTSSLENHSHSRYDTFHQYNQPLLEFKTHSEKNLSNIDGSSCKQSRSNFADDIGYLIGQIEYMKGELGFQSNIIDRLLVFICKSERAEIFSKKLVNQSIDPSQIRLGITNSDININWMKF